MILTECDLPEGGWEPFCPVRPCVWALWIALACMYSHTRPPTFLGQISRWTLSLSWHRPTDLSSCTLHYMYVLANLPYKWRYLNTKEHQQLKNPQPRNLHFRTNQTIQDSTQLHSSIIRLAAKSYNTGVRFLLTRIQWLYLSPMGLYYLTLQSTGTCPKVIRMNSLNLRIGQTLLTLPVKFCIAVSGPETWSTSQRACVRTIIVGPIAPIRPINYVIN